MYLPYSDRSPGTAGESAEGAELPRVLWLRQGEGAARGEGSVTGRTNLERQR